MSDDILREVPEKIPLRARRDSSLRNDFEELATRERRGRDDLDQGKLRGVPSKYSEE